VKTLTPQGPSIKGIFVKIVVPALALLASALAAPALAQSSERQFDAGSYAAARTGEPDTQVLMFIRIPMDDGGQKPEDPRIGFGVFSDCGRAATRVSNQHTDACAAQGIRSLEVAREFNQRDWLFSFSGEKRWVGVARWHPSFGMARVHEYGPVLSGPAFADED
jgi:hypothetical protein